MQKPLFLLLRLGLQTSLFEKEDISKLQLFSVAQWQALEEKSREQGVSAIVLDGLNVIIKKLGAGCFNRFDDRTFWPGFIAQWVIGVVEQGYEAGNKRQLRVIDELQSKWAAEGIRMMVMKGEAMGTYYSEPNHRCPGDIDCYLFGDYEKGNSVARKFADLVDEGWYKHSVIVYKGETIENHQYFVHTRDGKKLKELNKVLCGTLNVSEFDKLYDTGALLPPPMFNALFLTKHAMGHFLSEGLRLKQILDWALFLKQDANKVDWHEYYRICENFHMKRFSVVMTDIAVHYLGIQIENANILTDSTYTEKVLQSTIYDEDYVFNNGNSSWSNRWHIVRNLFHYRWKYEDVCEESIWRQLWIYIRGYLFHTE